MNGPVRPGGVMPFDVMSATAITGCAKDKFVKYSGASRTDDTTAVTVTIDSGSGTTHVWGHYTIPSGYVAGDIIQLSLSITDSSGTYVIPAHEPIMLVQHGPSTFPNVAQGNAGAVLTSGTGTAQLSVSGGAVTLGGYAAGQDPATLLLVSPAGKINNSQLLTLTNDYATGTFNCNILGIVIGNPVGDVSISAPGVWALNNAGNPLASSAQAGTIITNQGTINNNVLAITTNTARGRMVAPEQFLRPASSSTAFEIDLLLYTMQGTMEVPDAAPTIHARNAAGSSLDSLLGSTTMTLISAGRYKVAFNVASDATTQEVIFDATWAVNSTSFTVSAASFITDAFAVDFTSSDRANLGTVLSQANKIGTTGGDSSNIAAIKTKTDNLPGDPSSQATVLAAIGSPMQAGTHVVLNASQSFNNSGFSGVILSGVTLAGNNQTNNIIINNTLGFDLKGCTFVFTAGTYANRAVRVVGGPVGSPTNCAFNPPLPTIPSVGTAFVVLAGDHPIMSESGSVYADIEDVGDSQPDVSQLVRMLDDYGGNGLRATNSAGAAVASEANAASNKNAVLTAVAGINGSTGPGADHCTLNFKASNTPIADADVWISTDSAGSNVVAGTLQTDSGGNVTFLLDAGNTYYCWMQKDGENPIKGQLFTATAD